jgi:large subunit ribosomal protein L23
MGIFDIFKRKLTQKEKPARPKKISVKKELAPVAKKEEPKEPKLTVKEKRWILGILKKPRITEKASLMNSLGQYVFEVSSGANKNQIKKAVEGFYNINVRKVRIINIPARPRRLGRTQGMKSGFKKAIVTLREGEKIELMPH